MKPRNVVSDSKRMYPVSIRPQLQQYCQFQMSLLCSLLSYSVYQKRIQVRYGVKVKAKL